LRLPIKSSRAKGSCRQRVHAVSANAMLRWRQKGNPSLVERGERGRRRLCIAKFFKEAVDSSRKRGRSESGAHLRYNPFITFTPWLPKSLRIKAWPVPDSLLRTQQHKRRRHPPQNQTNDA
jgi:hypothetical protein